MIMYCILSYYIPGSSRPQGAFKQTQQNASKVNDSWGEQRGDNGQPEVSHSLRKSVRESVS